MAKCQYCGTGIADAEINYRPSTKGGYRNQSMRLCGSCVEKHDKAQEARKVMTIIVAVVVAIALLVAGVYLHRR